MLWQQPFIRFGIHPADARAFDVCHREMIWVGHEAIFVDLFGIDKLHGPERDNYRLALR